MKFILSALLFISSLMSYLHNIEIPTSRPQPVQETISDVGQRNLLPYAGICTEHSGQHFNE